MDISQSAEQIKALTNVQRHCEIISITLQSCSSKRARANTIFKEPFSVKPALSSVNPTLQNRQLVVEIGFEYTAWDSSEPPQRIFQIDCSFEAAYLLNDEYNPSDEELSSFGKGTAVFNCWSYAREFIRDMTSRMGHQAPVLPLLRITPKKQEVDTPQAVPAPLRVESESQSLHTKLASAEN